MKKLVLLVTLIVGLEACAAAQKLISKSFELKTNDVEMKFDFADTIVIEAWNRKTIQLDVSVDIDNNKYNDYYSLDVKEKGGGLSLTERIDIDGIQNAKGQKKHSSLDFGINYTLKVPVDLALRLNTISGQIELCGLEGKMMVNSVSGFIDYAIPVAHKATIDLSTVSGNVYSNIKFGDTPSKENSVVGTKRKLVLNDGNLVVELKTVSGDIYLRKFK